MFEPVLFQNAAYENASTAVLFCKDLLEKSGQTDAAQRLEGIEVVNEPFTAQLAHGVLQTLQVNGAAQEYVRVARAMLERLIADVGGRA